MRELFEIILVTVTKVSMENFTCMITESIVHLWYYSRSVYFSERILQRCPPIYERLVIFLGVFMRMVQASRELQPLFTILADSLATNALDVPPVSDVQNISLPLIDLLHDNSTFEVGHVTGLQVSGNLLYYGKIK